MKSAWVMESWTTPPGYRQPVFIMQEGIVAWYTFNDAGYSQVHYRIYDPLPENGRPAAPSPRRM
ncbi:MAG TPA: hypothetical protein DCY27_00695 [Desulfobacterales bacterium]|nr:hypothetical protein [Desulfobacterales bacterium]